VTLKNGAGTLVPSVELLYGSGLRTADRAGIVPNGGNLPAYVTVNTGLAQTFTKPGLFKDVTLRVDVVNLFDRSYLIRDGSGVGVGAPQYGERRGLFAGITKKF
jgi:outer membrane receptor protein involved in Fe transport